MTALCPRCTWRSGRSRCVFSNERAERRNLMTAQGKGLMRQAAIAVAADNNAISVQYANTNRLRRH
jgi:hypothetical protein